MKCTDVYEVMPDLAAGVDSAAPEVNDHLTSCAACAEKLEEIRKTMALLDEWQAPEPSPYFDTRLMARVREERAKPSGWLVWMRKPALAVSFAVLLVASAVMFRTDAGRTVSERDPDVIAAIPGTAVSDLQALDKNGELYSDFDVLDDLQVQQDVTANP